MKSKNKPPREMKKKPQVKHASDPAEPKVNSFYFDAPQFEKLLLNACIKCLQAYEADYPGETLYAFGLQAHIEFETLTPIILTEEKLNRVTQQELEWHADSYKGMSVDEIREIWRYQQYDYSEPHESFDDFDHFRTKLMGSFDGMLISAKSLVTDAEWALVKQTHEDAFRESCLRVLQALRSHNALGDGAQREDIFLILRFYGNNRFYNERLNPPRILERLHHMNDRARQSHNFLGDASSPHQSEV